MHSLKYCFRPRDEFSFPLRQDESCSFESMKVSFQFKTPVIQ